MIDFKKHLFRQFALMARAMGNGNRLEILEFLAQCEHSVEHLAEVTGLSVANTSQHLQQLRNAGLVSSRKAGQRVYYRLAGEDVTGLTASLKSVAESHLVEVDRLLNTRLGGKDEVEAMSREELIQRAARGEVSVLDVRPLAEFASGHIPGARNVPLAELSEHLAQLDPEKEIVAYCRGPYCVLAFDAVRLLRDRGFRARRLQDGFPEWKSAGLPVESGLA